MFRKIGLKIGLYLGVFFGIIVFFVLAMTIAHCIPNSWLEGHLGQALELLKKEGINPHPQFFYGGEPSMLDNFTDNWMLEMTYLDESKNALYSAMNNGGYARYWHGYQMFLRPMLVIFSYAEIRYFNTIVFFTLLFAVLIRLYKKSGWLASFCFLLSMIPMTIVLIPVSMQFISVFNIMFVFILFLLSFKDVTKVKNMPIFFMVAGMITNFFDLLTAPLITFGVPLVIYFLQCTRSEEYHFKQGIISFLYFGIAWACGYGFCWLMKWLIASVVLGRNVVANAIDQIFFRTMGDETSPTRRYAVYVLNIRNLFLQNKVVIICMVICLIILITFAAIWRVGLKKIQQSSLFLIVASMPYIWYFVLANHSQYHSFFTYRAQLVSLFAGLIFMISIIDWQKVSAFFSKTIEKIKGKIATKKEKEE